MKYRESSITGLNFTSAVRLYAIAAVAFVAAITASDPAFAKCANATDGAGVIADSTCDCDYWDALESHAWLTAEREVVQNQNLIAKADSVLEYTCFDSFLRVTVGPIAESFSDTLAFGPVPGRNEMSTDVAMLFSVYESLVSYIQLNFDHDFLGHRATGVDYNIGGTIMGGGGYFCDRMNVVWNAAKCYNFATRSHDQFFSFEEYRDQNDKRELPDPCTKDLRWSGQLDTALLRSPWDIGKQRTLNTKWHEVITEHLTPGNCQEAQPTGVQIQDVLQGDPGPDGFCTNPGCSYLGGSCQ